MTRLSMFDLTGRKALVTGGAVGIGRACATALAMAGADVAIAGRTAEPAERTCEDLRALGVNAYFVRCDVTDVAEVEGMVTEVVRRSGRLDIAVNNAGISCGGSALEISRQDWERTVGVNLSGLFFCAQQEARQMLGQCPRGGKIINIASVYSRVAGGNCAYNASKAGVVQLTRSLAAEWGRLEISVNCISPGWTLTPANRDLTPELRQRMRELTPLGTLMGHRDIHGAVVFLASPAAQFVTGQELVIDGGHSLNTWLTPPAHDGTRSADSGDEDAELQRDLERYVSKPFGNLRN